MRYAFSITLWPLLMVFTSLSAQNSFNCDDFFLEYYKVGPTRPIENMQAFCNGAEAAYYAERLMLKWHVNSDDVDNCTIYSYEKHGVNIDFTFWSSNMEQQDYNAGYNFVADKKIKQELGDKYKQLGVIGPNNFSSSNMFSEAFYNNFNNRLNIEKLNKNEIKLTLESVHTFADYFKDIKIVDKKTKKQFMFMDLVNGVTLTYDDKDKEDYRYFSFLLDNFNHPDYCKSSVSPNAMRVWVDVAKAFK